MAAASLRQNIEWKAKTMMPHHDDKARLSEEKQKRALSRSREKALSAIYSMLLHNTPIDEESLSVLEGITDHSDERANRGAARVAYNILNNQNALPTLHWDRLGWLEERITPTDNPLRQLSGYLRQMQVATAALENQKRRSFLNASATGIASPLMDATEYAERQYPAKTAHALQRAKVVSLYDRTQAATQFQHVHESDPEFFRSYTHEHGVYTYFSAEEVDAVPDSDDERRAAVRQSVRALNFSAIDIKAVLLWSVDSGFLRAHGAFWLNIAPYLAGQGYGLVFLVVGSPEEAQGAAEDAKNLMHALLGFRKPDKGREFLANISFVPVELPSSVPDPKTYYACARYIYADIVLEELNKPLFIFDIDMTVKESLDSFFAKVASYDFACPHSRGVASLFPWRRYMAGTVFVNNTDHGRNILRDIRRYIALGIVKPSSWTLDQNAITFAIERAEKTDCDLLDISTVARPLGQDPFRVFFERPLGWKKA